MSSLGTYSRSVVLGLDGPPVLPYYVTTLSESQQKDLEIEIRSEAELIILSPSKIPP